MIGDTVDTMTSSVVGEKRMSKALFVFVCLLCALATPALAADPATVSDLEKSQLPFLGQLEGAAGEGRLPVRYALVIGINKYNTPQLVALPELKNAENDAEGVADELEKIGFQVRRLTVKAKKQFEPNRSDIITRNEILSELAWLINQAKMSAVTAMRDPVVLVYFAGHGLSFNNQDYILASDFDPKFAEDLEAMAIPIQMILERISWARPVLRIMISDACRSVTPSVLRSVSGAGDVMITAKPGNNILKDLGTIDDAPGSNDTFRLYATLSSKTASDLGRDNNHGKFASALIDVLKDARSKAKPDSDNLKSLLSSVANSVFQKLANENGKQASESNTSSGDYLLLPSFKSYTDERDSWDGAKAFAKQLADSARVDEPAFAAAAYCSFRRFLDEAGRYSYYGSAAAQKMLQYRSSTTICPDALSSVLPTSSATTFERNPTSGWIANQPARSIDPSPARSMERRGFVPKANKLRYAQTNSVTQNDAKPIDAATPVPPVTVGALRRSFPLSLVVDLSGFNDDVPLDTLAITSSPTNLLSIKDRSTTIRALTAGSFVQVERVATAKTDTSPGLLQIRTSDQVSGIVRQNSIDIGRVALKFPVPMSVNRGTPALSDDADRLLRDNLITGIQIVYPADSKLSGFASAQALASSLFVDLQDLLSKSFLK